MNRHVSCLSVMESLNFASFNRDTLSNDTHMLIMLTKYMVKTLKLNGAWTLRPRTVARKFAERKLLAAESFYLQRMFQKSRNEDQQQNCDY